MRRPEATHEPAEFGYRFLDWRVEPTGNRLLRGDQPTEEGDYREQAVHLTPKAMDVLCFLLKNAGRVVSKDELLEEVWHGQAVTDDALVVTIYELRKALGDRARQPTYVQTVVRRGYRFLPAVESLSAPWDMAEESQSTPATPPTSAKPTPAPEPMKPSAEPPRWRFFSRALSLHPGAAALLGFGLVFLLLGSGPLDWTSKIQAGSLGPLVRVDSERDEASIKALLVAARRDLDRRSAASLASAHRRYLEIQRLRPDDPRALAGLARVAVLQADLRLGDRFTLYYEARALAEKVLALDPGQTDALLALTSAQMILEWDSPGAGRSLARALKGGHQDPDVHQTRSWWLSATGAHGEAIEAAGRALHLAPGSATKRADLAFVLMIAGQFEEAIREARIALDADPQNASAWGALIRSHFGTGHIDEALHCHLEMLRTFGAADQILEPWVVLAEEEGYWTFAERLLSATASEAALIPRAAALAHLGETENALALLERAAERRDWEILWLDRLPELQLLHAEPRFRDLLSRRNASTLST